MTENVLSHPEHAVLLEQDVQFCGQGSQIPDKFLNCLSGQTQLYGVDPAMKVTLHASQAPEYILHERQSVEHQLLYKNNF